MEKRYEVWTYYQGAPGARCYVGNKRMCNAYIRQAVKKGADKNRFIIMPEWKPGRG